MMVLLDLSAVFNIVDIQQYQWDIGVLGSALEYKWDIGVVGCALKLFRVYLWLRPESVLNYSEGSANFN